VRNIFRDPEFWAIFGFNVLLLYAFMQDITGFDTIIIIYYLQNIFIGIQYFVRMLAVSWRVSKNIFTSMFLPGFFALHYGGFHFVYLIFLLPIVNNIPGPLNFKVIFSAMAIMGINTIFSLVSDIKKDKAGVSSPGFFTPYLRVVPMHLLIMVGFQTAVAKDLTSNAKMLVIFIGLKLLSDLFFHVLINKTWKGNRPKAFGDIL
jgi:hypothetical protein